MGIICLRDFTSASSFPVSASSGANAATGSLTEDASFSGTSFPGNQLRVKDNSNNGKSIYFAFSTVGYTGLSMTFNTDRNSPGFNNDTVYYSTDGGVNYTAR